LWAPGAALLLVYVVLGTLVFTGIGFLLACVVESEGVVMDVINACTAPLIFVSEMFFPNDVLPDAARSVVALLPTTLMVSGARAVLLYGETRPAEILPGILGLAAWAAAAYAVSLRAFRWHR
jgi:ABC-type multidrug transport system permease subunit